MLSLRGDRGFESFPLHRRVCKPSVPREIRVTPEHSGGGRPSLLREAEIVPPAMIVAASSASVAAIPAASCAATPPQAVARRQCAARLQTAGEPRTPRAPPRHHRDVNVERGAALAEQERRSRDALHLLPQAQRIRVYIASEPLLRPLPRHKAGGIVGISKRRAEPRLAAVWRRNWPQG
jgi:hypothetical protein